MAQIEDHSEFDYSSGDEQEVYIFGTGLADKISRLPGYGSEEDAKPDEKPSKFHPSYLSSIQSIRTIEKEKLNKALQDRMNRLAIMDHNFKVMMNKRFLSQLRKEKIEVGSSHITQAEAKPEDHVPKDKTNKSQISKNLIKFCNTKNADFLFANDVQVSKPTNKRAGKNFDLPVRVDMDRESTASEILREIENQFEPSQMTTPREVAETEEFEHTLPEKLEVKEEVKEKQVENLHEDEARQYSSKSSMKPAKVVFKKATDDVSRAERANRMAHFEYIESGLANTHEELKNKAGSRFKVNNQLYAARNRKNVHRATSQPESNPVSIRAAHPLHQKKFSPKRFRRFPRFTIFLNKDQENPYEKENSISLNPQFLNFLMTPERAEIVDKGTI